MHELGIAEGILAVVDDIAAGRPVTRVVVRVGDDQRVVADSLEFGFSLLAEGTACADARLECVRVEGDAILVDEVELDGQPRVVLRRPGAGVVEAPHDHPHQDESGGLEPPVGSGTSRGGS